jgi:hypothetical protein
MMKTITVALLVIATSAGLAQARTPHRPRFHACANWQQAAAKCVCGTAANHLPLVCLKGQWCHPSQACTS